MEVQLSETLDCGSLADSVMGLTHVSAYDVIYIDGVGNSSRHSRSLLAHNPSRTLLFLSPLMLSMFHSACTAIRESKPLEPYLLRPCTKRRVIKFLERVSG